MYTRTDHGQYTLTSPAQTKTITPINNIKHGHVYPEPKNQTKPNRTIRNFGLDPINYQSRSYISRIKNQNQTGDKNPVPHELGGACVGGACQPGIAKATLPGDKNRNGYSNFYNIIYILININYI